MSLKARQRYVFLSKLLPTFLLQTMEMGHEDIPQQCRQGDVSASLGFLWSYSWCSEIVYPLLLLKTVGVSQENLFSHLLHPKGASKIEGLSYRLPSADLELLFSEVQWLNGTHEVWDRKICKGTIKIALHVDPLPLPLLWSGPQRDLSGQGDTRASPEEWYLSSVSGLMSHGPFFEGCVSPVMESTLTKHALSRAKYVSEKESHRRIQWQCGFCAASSEKLHLKAMQGSSWELYRVAEHPL